jgi:glycosyltransferase involved in cell wall biosynthesis
MQKHNIDHAREVNGLAAEESRLTASVVIVTYRRAEKLKASVAAVLAQTRPPNELIIINDASDGETNAAVEAITAVVPEAVRLVHLTIPDHSIALGENYGMLAATGDIIAFTDDDAEALPDWLERIMREYRQPGVGGVCGRDIIFQDGERVIGTTRKVGQISWRGSKKGFYHLEGAPRQEVSVMKGVNMSVRRVLAVLLDEHLLGPNEACWEDDLSLSVKKQGYELWYDPGIVVNHYREGAATDLQQQFKYFHNETYVILKHFSPPRQLAFIFWSFSAGLVFQLIQAVKNRKPGLFDKYVAGRMRGIRTYVRSRWNDAGDDCGTTEGGRQ